MGDVQACFAKAERMIEEQVGTILARSKYHTSPSWGFEAEQEFGNICLVVQSTLTPIALLDALQHIEQALGRDRLAEQQEKRRSGARYTSRTIDLDVLLYDQEHIVTERLTVPHALLRERDFALTPLGEVLGMEREALIDYIEKIEQKRA